MTNSLSQELSNYNNNDDKSGIPIRDKPYKCSVCRKLIGNKEYHIHKAVDRAWNYQKSKGLPIMPIPGVNDEGPVYRVQRCSIRAS